MLQASQNALAKDVVKIQIYLQLAEMANKNDTEAKADN
jgi:hypothetical protein